MAHRVLYGLDADGVERDRLIEAITHLWHVVEDDVTRFQCDVPAPGNHRWTPEVDAAAGTLRAASSRRQRQAWGCSTGWLGRDDPAVWQAFITFAPSAYGADAYDEARRPIAEVNDEGTSVAFALTDEQHVSAAAAVAPLRLLPLPGRRRRAPLALRPPRRDD